MKKLLNKFSVAITSGILAVVLLVFYIIMLSRPISYGMNYKYKTIEEGTEITITINVKNKKTATVSYATEYTITSAETWVYYYDNYLYLVGAKETMNETEYDTEVLRIKENRATAMVEYKEENMLFKTSAFKMKIDGDELKCAGASAFATIVIIIEIAVISFAVTSTILAFKKHKQKQNNIDENNENNNENNDVSNVESNNENTKEDAKTE